MRIMVMPAKRALEFSEVKNFSGVWQFYIRRELEAMEHQIVFERGALPNDTPKEQEDYFKSRLIPRLREMDVDHVLGFSRYFTRVTDHCVHMLQDSFKGAVTQIHDGPLPGVPCDQVFSIRDDEGHRGHTHIGWAADPEILISKERGPGLRILIDHPHYHDGMPDFTNTITEQAIEYKRRARYPVQIRRFCDGGAEEVTSYAPVKSFRRVHIPFENFVEEYSRADMFLPTHIESLGLSVLEAAMCGALIVSHVDFIRADRIATVRSVIYQGNDKVPFDYAAKLTEPVISREVAMQQSWRAVTERIVGYLQAFRK